MKRKDLKSGDWGSQRIVENHIAPKPVDPTVWPKASILEPPGRRSTKQRELTALERVADALEELTDIMKGKK